MKVQDLIKKHQLSTLEMFILATPAQQKNFCLKNNLPLLSITELGDLLQIITTQKVQSKINEIGFSALPDYLRTCEISNEAFNIQPDKITVAFLKMLKEKNEEFLNQKNHVNRGLSPKLPIPQQSQTNIHAP